MLHQLQVVPLAFVQVGAGQQIQNADHAVHRRADLVAHGGEEFAFCLVGTFCAHPLLLLLQPFLPGLHQCLLGDLTLADIQLQAVAHVVDGVGDVLQFVALGMAPLQHQWPVQRIQVQLARVAGNVAQVPGEQEAYQGDDHQGDDQGFQYLEQCDERGVLGHLLIQRRAAEPDVQCANRLGTAVVASVHQGIALPGGIAVGGHHALRDGAFAAIPVLPGDVDGRDFRHAQQGIKLYLQLRLVEVPERTGDGGDCGQFDLFQVAFHAGHADGKFPDKQ